MDRKSLDQAATLAGIAANYINAHGKSQAISAQTKQQLLAAMGRTSVPPDSQTEKAPLPPVKIFTFGSAMQLPMAGSGDYHWQLQTEKGDLHQGRISAKKTLTLPAALPQGYHRLVLEQGLQQWQCSVIVAPKRCYEP
ncbi:4-alpha-glucanotransferase, partial [Yersinia enterocolitica]